MTDKPTLKALSKEFDDKDLFLFFVAWLKNSQNATRAYLELNPNVTEDSARVLGSKQLAKINISSLLAVYGLDADSYFQQLKDGLEANRTISAIGGKEANGGTVDFIDVPDHKTRKDYHDKLGKLLGYEVAANSVLNVDARTQVNNFTITPEVIQEADDWAVKRVKELIREGKVEKDGL